MRANGRAGIAANGYWSPDSYDQNFDQVYDRAVSAGWNPAFVIALWIEESGASSLSAWDLGCRYDSNGNEMPKNNIELQLNCLFDKSYANESYQEFMLTYSEGNRASRQAQIDAGQRPADALDKFCTNKNFPRALWSWYQRLTGQ